MEPKLIIKDQDGVKIDTTRLAALVDRINRTSNADFAKRLQDKNRRVLNIDDGNIATHRMGWATDDAGAIVYPEVQTTDYGGFLQIYPGKLGIERAIERGDTVRMSVPDAKLFTENYKLFYPGF